MPRKRCQSMWTRPTKVIVNLPHVAPLKALLDKVWRCTVDADEKGVSFEKFGSQSLHGGGLVSEFLPVAEDVFAECIHRHRPGDATE